MSNEQRYYDALKRITKYQTPEQTMEPIIEHVFFKKGEEFLQEWQRMTNALANIDAFDKECGE